MILVKIWGGLGNQLFQYALARWFAIERGLEVKLDLSSFAHQSNENNDYRRYRLGLLRTKTILATREETARYERGIVFTRAENLAMRLADLLPDRASRQARLAALTVARAIVPLRFRTYAKEQLHRYQPAFQTLSDVCLEGYWQSPRYFPGIKPFLKTELLPNEELVNRHPDFWNEIRNRNAVAVHIRRTDYLRDPVFWTCRPEYYDTAAALIQERVHRPVFFVFSDDMEWVKKNLTFPGQTVFASEHLGMDVLDLYAMTLCKHHITANSTFSWWGAWLADNPDGIVTTLSQWLNPLTAAKLLFTTVDLIPAGWIQIGQECS